MDNNNSIIEALSEAEEASLIVHAQAGNERAMERLLDVYSPAIERTARKHAHDGDIEDALQEARLAFVQIVLDHDFDKAKRLNYYVHARMDNRMTVALSESSNPWGIPGRTLRRFYQVWEKADGDVNLGAQIAPDYDLAALTFTTIAEMLHVGSLDAFSGEEEEAGSILDTFDGPALGNDSPGDAIDALLDRLTVEKIMDDSLGEEFDRVIRMAYGFEGDLDTGEEVAPVLPSTVSLAAHSDATVAAALTWQGEKVWSRAKVQRSRTKQLSDWREKYAKDDAPVNS